MSRAIFGTRLISLSDVPSIMFWHPPSRGESVPSQTQILAEVSSSVCPSGQPQVSCVRQAGGTARYRVSSSFPPSNKNGKTVASSQRRHSGNWVSNLAHIAFNFITFPRIWHPPNVTWRRPGWCRNSTVWSGRPRPQSDNPVNRYAPNNDVYNTIL